MSLLLTVKEAAQELRRSESWIRQEIRAHRLRSVKFGRNQRILAEELRRFVERKNAVSPNGVPVSNIELYNQRRAASRAESEGVTS